MMLTAKSFPGSRAFARWMLRDDRMPIEIEPARICRWLDRTIEVILFRQSCWQVELISVLPGGVAKQHRHMRVDSCELCLGGGVLADVDGRQLNTMHRGPLAANLIRVPMGAWHGGESGPNGVVWLSFQHWVKGSPGWVSEDWEEQS